MTLDAFLLASNMTAAEFGARIGLSEASVSRIRKGDQNITRDVMRRIISASGGEVTADSLVHIDNDARFDGVTSSGKAQRISAEVAS